ncbi:hypothetical protein E2C01_068487 [Portunus trituberculatus]|uniref:Uncharacterized protein n=1 Tax=Portunus trituberculatus TaxID=210409 RepID=A0A5B7HZK0_PORTR|nr:hypothetical protein [Portunus trituberculatus]
MLAFCFAGSAVPIEAHQMLGRAGKWVGVGDWSVGRRRPPPASRPLLYSQASRRPPPCPDTTSGTHLGLGRGSCVQKLGLEGRCLLEARPRPARDESGDPCPILRIVPPTAHSARLLLAPLPRCTQPSSSLRTLSLPSTTLEVPLLPNPPLTLALHPPVAGPPRLWPLGASGGRRAAGGDTHSCKQTPVLANKLRQETPPEKETEPRGREAGRHNSARREEGETGRGGDGKMARKERDMEIIVKSGA